MFLATSIAGSLTIQCVFPRVNYDCSLSYRVVVLARTDSLVPEWGVHRHLDVPRGAIYRASVATICHTLRVFEAQSGESIVDTRWLPTTW